MYQTYSVRMKCFHPGCNEVFTDTRTLNSHWKLRHNPTYRCPHCAKVIKNYLGSFRFVLRLALAERTLQPILERTLEKNRTAASHLDVTIGAPQRVT